MKKPRIALTALMLALLLLTVSAVLAQAPGFQQQHHQFRNVEQKWTKGAINFINSDYVEGDSVPYRYEFKDVPAGDCIQMEIHYDFTRGKGANEKHAFDFLTNVKRTEGSIIDGLTGKLFSSPQTPLTGLVDPDDCAFMALQIPDDGDTNVPDDALAPQYFTLCGSYDPDPTKTYVVNGPTAVTKGQNTEKVIALQIKTTGTEGEVVDLAIAWGGHLARGADWPNGGAGSIQGAPYHMRGNGYLDVNCNGQQDKPLDRDFDDGDRAIQIRDDVVFGTIIIVKEADPADSTHFPFDGGSLGSFKLKDGASKTFSDLLPDTYEVQELVPNGWELTDVECTPDNGWTFDGTDTVTIELDPLEEITCTFTNKHECEDAITLASFTAEAGADGVTLAWETGTEVDNAGFNLYRALLKDGPYTKINDALISAEGDAVGGASYSFLDAPDYGTFYYQLEDVDFYGLSTLHGPVKVTVARPSRRPLYRPRLPEF